MEAKITILKKTVGERIKELAKEKGISLSQLETQVGYSLGMITRWCNANPNEEFGVYSKLSAIACVLDTSTDGILGLTRPQVRDARQIDDDLVSCIELSTRKKKLTWTEVDWETAANSSFKHFLEAKGERTLACAWSAERTRIQFLLAAFCDDLDDADEPMELRLYAAGGHGIMPSFLQADVATLQALYLTIQLHSAHQSLRSDTIEQESDALK